MVSSILFDLDGTLVDTAPDLLYTTNKLRQEHNLPDLSMQEMRPKISLGSKEMIKYALGIDETDKNFLNLRKQFLDIYEEHLADATQLFPNIDEVLAHLEESQIPWGIVTNKLTRHSLVLLKKLGLDSKAACVVCGDTLPTYKPDPEPILHACRLIRQEPEHCIYIGDSRSDVIASKAAGIRSLVALYGYIGKEEDPYSWLADGYICEPIDIVKWTS